MGTDCDSCGNTPEKYMSADNRYEIWITDCCNFIGNNCGTGFIIIDFDKQNFVL